MILKLIFSLSILSFIPQSNPKTASYDLELTVKNIKTDEGKILVHIFNSEEGFLKNAYSSKLVEAKQGSLNFIFEDLPEGEYTAYVLHDKNENGELDMNKFGIPNEPYGMSESGKNRFGPPNYEKAIFKVDSLHKAIQITVD